MISLKKRIKNDDVEVIYISALKEVTVGTVTTNQPVSVNFSENEKGGGVSPFLASTISDLLRYDRDAKELMYTQIVEGRGLTNVTPEEKAKILATLKMACIKYNTSTKEIVFEIIDGVTSLFKVDITDALLRKGSTMESKICIPLRMLHKVIIEYTEGEISSVILALIDIILAKTADYLYGPLDAQYLPSDTVVVPVLVVDVPVITPEPPAEEPPAEEPPAETPVV